MEAKTQIALSKGKIIKALIGAIIFIVLGCLFAVSPQTFVSPIMRNPELIKISGILAIFFFGLCSIFIIRKLIDNKPGLIIDHSGITDNTHATSVGLIEWKDIVGIELRQVMSTRYLILHTNNPGKYIQKAKNVISKRAMIMNAKVYGSPISIVSNSLKIKFDDLEQLLTAELEEKRDITNV